MSQDEVAYFRSRAAAEREAAKDASRAEIAEIHQELARLYDALIENEHLRPVRMDIGEDPQNKNANVDLGEPNDMGQGSFEESLAAGKGPSRSKQGPKKVILKKDR